MSNDTLENTVAFESMSFDELLSLRERLDAFIADRLGAEERELETRLARIRRLKQVPSVSSEAVNGHNGKRPGGQKLPPRYRNPENPSQTWAGRGLQPRWLKQALKSGKKLSHFMVAEVG
jgi:DNA-binding protein H-NS